MANTTRASLVLRLRDHTDAEAWEQFVDIYGPLVYRYGRQHALQDADAADLAQDVLREISKSIVGFEYKPELGRFRSWLFLITRRTLGKRFRAQHRVPVVTGDTKFLKRLGEQPDDQENEHWNREYRMRVFQWSCDQISAEFAETTWQAFWRTAVQGQKPAEVADALQLKLGSVYVAKNRVLRRLREKIASVDDNLDI